MSAYFLSRAADLDVDQLYEFGLGEWGERQADRYLHGLFDAFERIGLAPGIGRHRPELHATLRSLRHDSHLIIYSSVGAQVAIIRVVHGSADIKRVFADYDPVASLKR